MGSILALCRIFSVTVFKHLPNGTFSWQEDQTITSSCFEQLLSGLGSRRTSVLVHRRIIQAKRKRKKIRKLFNQSSTKTLYIILLQVFNPSKLACHRLSTKMGGVEDAETPPGYRDSSCYISQGLENTKLKIKINIHEATNTILKQVIINCKIMWSTL